MELLKKKRQVLSLPTPNKATNQCGEEAVHMVNRVIPDYFRPDMRRNQLAGSFGAAGAESGSQPPRSKSTEGIYTRQQLEASAAIKESFFARRMADNESKPEGGRKYVGFGSSPAPSVNRNSGAAQDDVMQVVSQDGTWSTITGSCTVVRDLKDMLFHSYFSIMDDLCFHSTPDGKPHEIRVLDILGAVFAAACGL